MSLWNNYGMNRRHFMQHMATAAATIPAMNFLSHVQANADVLKSSQKSCILMWMGGGPPTIDIWDLKPGSKNGGEFQPIDTARRACRFPSTCRRRQRCSATCPWSAP